MVPGTAQFRESSTILYSYNGTGLNGSSRNLVLKTVGLNSVNTSLVFHQRTFSTRSLPIIPEPPHCTHMRSLPLWGKLLKIPLTEGDWDWDEFLRQFWRLPDYRIFEKIARVANICLWVPKRTVPDALAKLSNGYVYWQMYICCTHTWYTHTQRLKFTLHVMHYYFSSP